LLAVLFGGTLWPQQEKDKVPQKPKATEQAKPQQQEQEPPEEDESLKPREYPFNPLEAENDVRVGNFYFKQGKYKSALGRFREATRFNPTYAAAYLRLGDTEEKMKDKQAAQEAYAKYLELAPDGKEAEAVKKKLAAKR
jgi:tetratricopeptide (TPR) repeat protein